jgi:RHS repeat-associated protein
VASLRASCTCAEEQHYSFRWDELNRLVDGRRYDRNSTTSGTWVHGARLRYRYDAANQRTVKEVLTAPTTGGGGDGGFGRGVGGFGRGVGGIGGGGGGGWTTSERVTLFVYPGDFERRGLTRGWSSYQPVTAGDGLLPPIDRNRRATINVTDLLGTTGAVVDLLSGDLVEVSTYYPNGARENLWTNDALVPIEPMGFTTKEADEEIGVTYFGERWLIPRLGRWATPDPLHVLAAGGGEALNSYHYVSGSLLQAVDPWGLSPGDADSRAYVADSQGARVLNVHEGYDANGDPFMTFTEVGATPYELGLLQRQADIQAWQEGRASDPIEREAAPQVGACEGGGARGSRLLSSGLSRRRKEISREAAWQARFPRFNRGCAASRSRPGSRWRGPPLVLETLPCQQGLPL